MLGPAQPEKPSSHTWAGCITDTWANMIRPRMTRTSMGLYRAAYLTSLAGTGRRTDESALWARWKATACRECSQADVGLQSGTSNVRRGAALRPKVASGHGATSWEVNLTVYTHGQPLVELDGVRSPGSRFPMAPRLDSIVRGGEPEPRGGDTEAAEGARADCARVVE